MKANSAVPLDDQKEKPNFLVEVNNIEKQLWALMHSKGLLHPDVKDLYWKAGSTYEKIFKNDLKHEELQDVEYYLWKLHYKHIDEFRKAMKTAYRVNSEGQKRSVTAQNSKSLLDEFESFLVRATEFYQNLIVKIKRHYGISKEFFTQEGDILSASLESKEVQKCKFLSHRFCVCLGDLARYREQYLKVGNDCPTWSAAANHYIEAAKIWPDSGNPHNQLAVLATYVGDEFLALYHCVRSLAIKEPFPDAWNNLLLLFERNRLSQLHFLSVDARFDFSKPSERYSAAKSLPKDSNLSNCSRSNAEKEFIAGTNLWPLVVRTMSFFFLNSSLDEFPSVFASTMTELDIALAADDRNLEVMLESYQLRDSGTKGPFRIVQLVSVLIFIFHNLSTNLEKTGSDGRKQEVTLTHLVFATAFIIMGRLVERCLKTNSPNSYLLLPAVLVFTEYLPVVLDEAEECRLDDKSTTAMNYFFGAFVDLLNQLNLKCKSSTPEMMALWEDHELRAFAPVSPAHTPLDFSSHHDLRDSFETGNELRLQRIMNSAFKIANRQKGSQKWISCDKHGTRFSTALSVTVDRKASTRIGCGEEILDEIRKHAAEEEEEEKAILSEGDRKCDPAGTEFILGENDKCVAAEEEEVILLKPLTRFNSAPLCPCVNTKNELEGSYQTIDNQTVSSDDSLRRATSLLVNHIPQETNASNFSFSEGFKDTESRPFLEGTISGRPPSLSAWVVNVSTDKEKTRSTVSKHNGLSPIDETAAIASFGSFSINKTEHSSTNNTSSYSPPTPSAPLLPEDASWFHDKSNKADNFHGQIGPADSNLLNYGLPLPSFIKRYPKPPFVGMSSSEWLRRYRENQSLEAGDCNQAHSYQAQATNNLRNFLSHESSKFSLLDRYGTPGDHPRIYSENSLFYPGFDPQFYLGDYESKGYQRTNAFDLRDGPRQLLRYLKEKEWLMEHDQRLRGPPAL